MSGDDFEVEWLDDVPAPVGALETEEHRRPAAWLIAIAVLAVAAVVPFVIAPGHTRHATSPPPLHRPPSPVRLVSCASLVGTSGWNNALAGAGCTLNGHTAARFQSTNCVSGSRLWSIRTPNVGYWAITGVLFHRFTSDPAHDRAYLVAAAQCARKDPTQHVKLGSTALVETFDGDFDVTLSVRPRALHNGAAAEGPATISMLIKCVYGTTPIDSFSLGGQGSGTWREVVDPAQLTLPILTLSPGRSATGRAVFPAIGGHTPTVFWWGNDLNNPLVYWS